MSELSDLLLQTGLTENKVREALALLLKDIEKEKRATPHTHKEKDHGDVKVYMTLHWTTFCLHCKSRHMRVVHLGKKETASALQEDGTVRTIYALNRVEEPIELSSYTTTCPSCPKAIRSLTRVELEQAYLFLLGKMGFKEVRNAFR